MKSFGCSLLAATVAVVGVAALVAAQDEQKLTSQAFLNKFCDGSPIFMEVEMLEGTSGTWAGNCSLVLADRMEVQTGKYTTTRVAGDLIVSSVAGALRGGKFQVEEMSSLSANSIDAAVDKVQVKKGSTVEATAGDVSIMAMREVQVEEGAVVRAKGGAVSLMAGREVQLKITSTVSSDVSVVVSAPKCQAEQPSTVTAPDVKVCMM
ncbi:hypothetical protein BU14_0368s0009 [Porphyra umbilicalis]|uniref:Auto-transporter adhesin head GIN domain-containing protein n=1 Tax=Porphyra umbilicalis TaxID=2786 RepID=A0A1X6NX39_PORUM|nr:hypothetical protein BU14_0368s0009 [Porphyra umbilicalis]|eukprot:OSX73209.1 hypothetical protein BU14_0368s0009 [Porphyra umbilicalis]